MSAPTPRRSRVGLVLVLALIMGAAGAGFAWWWNQRDALADPTTVELPAGPSDSTAVRDYLLGPGAPLVGLVDATGGLSVEATADTCPTLAAPIDPLGTPAALADMAAGVPDPDTADAAGNLVGATGRYFLACADGADLDTAAEDVTFARTVFTRILERAQVR